jgi:hypothetical protein
MEKNMGLNLPAQGAIDRREMYQPSTIRIDVRNDKGELVEVLFEEVGGSYSEHHPGDPSRFRYPATRGWNCASLAAGTGGCIWMGFL